MAQKDATTLAYWLKRTKGTKNAVNKAYTLQKRAVKAAGRTGRVDPSKVVRSEYGRKTYLGESSVPKARNVGMPESRSVTSGAPPMRKSGGNGSGIGAAGAVAGAGVAAGTLAGGAMAVRKARAQVAARTTAKIENRARLRKNARARIDRESKAGRGPKYTITTDEVNKKKRSRAASKGAETRKANQQARERAQQAADKAKARQQAARAGARTAGAPPTPKGQSAPRPVRIVNYTALGDAPSPEARRGSGGRLGRAARVSSGRR